MSYLLVQLTDEFYPLLQAHGNTIELNVPQDLTVEGDAGKLARVFNNLLKNAVSYSTPGTPILLWAEQADEQAQFFVQNRGKTIPAHQLTPSLRSSSAWTRPAPPPPAARAWGWQLPRRSSPSTGEHLRQQ